jgi:hypothetical protein
MVHGPRMQLKPTTSAPAASRRFARFVEWETLTRKIASVNGQSDDSLYRMVTLHTACT